MSTREERRIGEQRRIAPLPEDFLAWQVELRRHTMQERGGRPHVGVAPLLTVRMPGTALGVTSHSIICGVLPAPARLHEKTGEFRALYEAHAEGEDGDLYTAGIRYLQGYYKSPEDFDPDSLTTLLQRDLPVVKALRAEARCELLFYVFDLEHQSPLERMRCTQLSCVVDVLEEGPVYDNVWWHNALFHGFVDEHVVVRFRHFASWDTSFGALEPLAG